MIEHSNIIYMPTISELGGIETYVYELVKKYRYLDIGVVCKSIDEKQRIRLAQYCPVYIHKKEKIKCDVCVINYDQSIIDFIDKKAKIYQTIHADYSNPIYKEKPKIHPRVEAFITITKYLDKKLDYLGKRIMSYNPLTVEKHSYITIVSATRLHKHKGYDRMIELIRALDRLGIDFIWYILTCDKGVINHPNVIMLNPRLDVYKWLDIADYVCLLSDSEACSYTLNEALIRNIPIITTPLPYLEEIGYKDEINGYTIDFNCKNVEEVARKLINIPKFEFKKLEDKYNKIFTNKRTNHNKEENMIEVEALDTYVKMNISDGGLGYIPKAGEHFKVSKDRLETLLGKNTYNVAFVKVIEEEKAVAPTPKEEKAILPKKKKK